MELHKSKAQSATFSLVVEHRTPELSVVHSTHVLDENVELSVGERPEVDGWVAFHVVNDLSRLPVDVDLMS